MSIEVMPREACSLSAIEVENDRTELLYLKTLEREQMSVGVWCDIFVQDSDSDL